MDAALLRYSQRPSKSLRLVVCIVTWPDTCDTALATTHASVMSQHVPEHTLVYTSVKSVTLDIVAKLHATFDLQQYDCVVAIQAGVSLHPQALAVLLAFVSREPSYSAVSCGYERSTKQIVQLGPVPGLDPAEPTQALPLLAWLTTNAEQAAMQVKPARLPALLCQFDHSSAWAEPARVMPQTATASPAFLSVIIPTRDGGEVLRACLKSVLAELALCSGPVELIVVDNGSRDPATLHILSTLATQYAEVLRVLTYDQPFNYSAINNWAVQQARGQELLLLNDDILASQPGWLSAMRAELANTAVGVVGARLFYPDGCLQHAGVALGLGGVAGHPGRGLPADDLRWYNWPHDQRRRVSAVTGACLLTSRAVYSAVGGLNEQSLSVAFNDVDFCLKAGHAGWQIMYTPAASLTHYESLSRGDDDNPAKQRRFAAEIRYMQQQWPQLIADDPFYSPHLSLELDDLGFRQPTSQSLLTPRCL